jgi:flagellar biosynthesis GTPase FlhF
MTQQTYTYRGRTLEEIVPRIRAELGEDAVIVGRRETTSGGVGGFFARREIEVEARPGKTAAAVEAFRRQLEAAQQRQREGGAGPRPTVGPEVDALPGATDVTVDDLFPPAPRNRSLADLFSAGLPHTETRGGREEGAPAAEVDQPTGAFDFIKSGGAPVPPAAPSEAPAESGAADERELFVGPPPAAEGGAGPEPKAPAAEGPAPRLSLHAPDAARDVAARIAARGLRRDLAEAVVADALVGLMPLRPEDDPAALVADALERRIPVAPLRHGPGVVGFVGPAGAGKTRCVARLAAAYDRHSQLPVTVVSLQPPDDGAEIERLLSPYDADLHVVGSGVEGAGAVTAARDRALVIIDTPGVSPRDTDALRALAGELSALAPDELHLVVPATIGPDAARELWGGARELGVNRLALTHTDETEQLGTGIGLALDAGLPLSYLGRGQAVDVGLAVASAAELTERLVR